MELGAFSISLAVKDIEASKAFYVVPCPINLTLARWREEITVERVLPRLE